MTDVMVEAVPWKAVEYGNGLGGEAVALVAGFDGKIDALDLAARDLARDRDVVVYEYGSSVLLDGQPGHLPDLVGALSADFQRRTSDHLRRRYGGVSLGGAIAASMQKNDADPAPGIYAATGIDAAWLVMNNPIFRALIQLTHHKSVRHAFKANGYDRTRLREQWQDIHIPPATPFTLALGGVDRIVRPKEIGPIVAGWKATNDGIRIIEQPLGHNGMIKWFNRNAGSMLGPRPELIPAQV